MADEYDDFEHLIASLATAASRGSAAVLAPYGLSPLEFGILEWCRRREANSISELAEVFPVDVSVVSRNATRLVDRGLLSKRRPPENQRRVELSLTEEGLALARRIEDPVRAGRAEIVEGVSDDEWAAFAATARKILANLERMQARPRGWTGGG